MSITYNPSVCCCGAAYRGITQWTSNCPSFGGGNMTFSINPSSFTGPIAGFLYVWGAGAAAMTAPAVTGWTLGSAGGNWSTGTALKLYVYTRSQTPGAMTATVPVSGWSFAHGVLYGFGSGPADIVSAGQTEDTIPAGGTVRSHLAATTAPVTNAYLISFWVFDYQAVPTFTAPPTWSGCTALGSPLRLAHYERDHCPAGALPDYYIDIADAAGVSTRAVRSYSSVLAGV